MFVGRSTALGELEFMAEMSQLYQDPRIRSYAVRMAGDLAEDALQETWLILAQVHHRKDIQNLRAYFMTVLLNEIRRLQRRSRERLVPVEDTFASDPALAVPGPGEDGSDLRVTAERWLTQLLDDRERLKRAIPGRSRDADCYRAVIITVITEIVGLGLAGAATHADLNEILREEYPTWFRERGLSADVADQRLSRARQDVRRLLQAIIEPQDLSPPPRGATASGVRFVAH
jgi:DNA-directed RNA polymerase specialized sigma24 family protein